MKLDHTYAVSKVGIALLAALVGCETSEELGAGLDLGAPDLEYCAYSAGGSGCVFEGAVAPNGPFKACRIERIALDESERNKRQLSCLISDEDVAAIGAGERAVDEYGYSDIGEVTDRLRFPMEVSVEKYNEDKAKADGQEDTPAWFKTKGSKYVMEACSVVNWTDQPKIMGVLRETYEVKVSEKNGKSFDQSSLSKTTTSARLAKVEHIEAFSVDLDDGAAGDSDEAFRQKAAELMVEHCACPENETWDEAEQQCVHDCSTIDNCSDCTLSNLDCTWAYDAENDSYACDHFTPDEKAKRDENQDIHHAYECTDCTAGEGDTDMCLGLGHCGVCVQDGGAFGCEPLNIFGSDASKIPTLCPGGYFPGAASFCDEYPNDPACE